MAGTVKIAISLPQETLELADLERRARGETRSEFFRRAVEQFIRRLKTQEAVERYLEGYREHPEVDDEAAAVHQLSVEALAREPWE